MSNQDQTNQFLNENLKPALKSQYHSALATLRETIEKSSDELWLSREHPNAYWQHAYHALFFTHLYIQTNEAAFQPWEHHQKDVQFMDGIPGPADLDSTLPLIPAPYSRESLLQYCDLCDGMVDEAIDTMDLLSPESGFSWYKISKLEHQIVNIRHIQHHAAQLADRLRNTQNIGIDWVGARKK